MKAFLSSTEKKKSFSSRFLSPTLLWSSKKLKASNEDLILIKNRQIDQRGCWNKFELI